MTNGSRARVWKRLPSVRNKNAPGGALRCEEEHPSCAAVFAQKSQANYLEVRAKPLYDYFGWGGCCQPLSSEARARLGFS